jgi:hypothetical protein
MGVAPSTIFLEVSSSQTTLIIFQLMVVYFILLNSPYQNPLTIFENWATLPRLVGNGASF